MHMKQKVFPRFLYSFLFSLGFLFTPFAFAEAQGLFIIGDSIATGIIQNGGLNPEGYHARGNAQTREIAGYSITGPPVQASNPSPITRFPANTTYDRVVISAGSNCPSCSNNARDLQAIRNKFPANARVVWVVPYNSTAASTVRGVAGGDQLVELSLFTATERSPNAPVHPANYAAVGAAIREKLGSGGATPATPGQTQPPSGSNFTGARDPSVIEGTSTGLGLIPCGRRDGQGEDSQPCTACHAVLAGKKLIDYLTSIMVVVAIAVIVGMGVLYIMSGVNVALKKTAKAGLTAVLVGLIFMLSAWLIVNTILRFLATPEFIQGGEGFISLQAGEGVFGLQCNLRSDAGTAVMSSSGGIYNTGQYQGAAGAGGNGTCSPITDGSNPCSVNNLSATCFGSNAETWSRMCNLESRGTPIQSQTDRCMNFGGKSFSGGLFQINIIANGAMLNRERCSNIATVSLADSNCAIRNRAGVCTGWRTCVAGRNFNNWDYCMGLTMNPETNLQAACTLSGNGHNTRPWPHTRRVCGVPTRI